ncbi:component of IIS longevity pathway SMK-1-domain-containing protein [Cyathus striatus]|nr:component of IIS longevity pathway SMK-1-domain-containing protein [Cyathus striatus]
MNGALAAHSHNEPLSTHRTHPPPLPDTPDQHTPPASPSPTISTPSLPTPPSPSPSPDVPTPLPALPPPDAVSSSIPPEPPTVQPSSTPHDQEPTSSHHPKPLQPSSPLPAPLTDANTVQLNQIKSEDQVTHQHVNGQIELVEHTPDIPGDLANPVEEGGEWAIEGEHELKRVKVYELIGSRWIDQGTAFCFGQFQEETNEALLIARAERNYNDIILSTAIRSNDVYQRQQDTLIVWTEPDGVDYALSFQDPEGCLEVWNFILEVQRHMNSGNDPTNISSPLLGEGSVTTASIIRSGHLPQPQLGIIGEIERAIKALARTQVVKERVCEYIQQEDYIKQLIEVMNTAEDLESLENLHALCSLMQTILMLNDHSMYEHILDDDIFFGVVGMLEYDPDFPNHKANYREFLHSTAQFHQPIIIRDPLIQRKIHHTYRLQFLKDVVLARALDDSTFNVLNSCILFNQIDIINHIQGDPQFLKDILKLFVDEEMLNPAGKKMQMLQQHQQPQQNQPVVISLNGEGDNVTSGKDSAAMDVDPKPGPSSATSTPPSAPSSSLPGTPVNGAPIPNGRPVASPAKRKNYGFAPPDDLTEEQIELRREVVTLIQQLCIMGKNVQLPARMALFRTLVDRGILFAVQWALALPEREPKNKAMISAAGEILSALLDHDLNGVRGHVLKQVVAIEKERGLGKKGADKAETILELGCRLMAQSKDLAVQSQVGDALKVWMDVPPGDIGGPSGGEAAGPPKPPQRKDDPGTERYMDYFYKECVHVLFKPLSELTEWKNVKGPLLLTREETNRYVYMCDLLYNYISQHHFRSLFYVISSNIVTRIATLLKARDKHLRHGAFRIFRLMLRQNNANIHESRRDNLLSSSCMEYFENMRRENMKEMINPLGGQRFQLLVKRWEMNNEPLPEETKPKTEEFRWVPQDGRSLDAEEEDYFNADDDEEDHTPPPRSSSPLPLLAKKRKRHTAISATSKGYRPQQRSPLLGLVEYGEEDEDSTSVDSAGANAKAPSSPSADVPSSPKLVHRQLSSSSGPPPKRPASEEDEEDQMLELLVRPKSRADSPIGGTSPVLSPLRPSEKRRRLEEEEDDEMLVRLSKSKKPDLGTQKSTSGGKTENGDDPPKKIKLKFSATSFPVANPPTAPSPTAPSETGAKDGDTG